MRNPVFDTLNYAKILKEGGIEHADTHASSLADAISFNVYTKHEVDTMFQEMLYESNKKFQEARNESDKRFQEMLYESDKIHQEMRTESDKRFQEIRSDFRKDFDEIKLAMAEDRAKHEKEMLKIENRLIQLIVETNNKTIQRLTIHLGIFITIFTIISSVLHIH